MRKMLCATGRRLSAHVFRISEHVQYTARFIGTARITMDAKRRDNVRRLLLVWHSRTGLAEQLADALEEGARSAAAEMLGDIYDRNAVARFELRRVSASAATLSDLLEADAYAFVAPENLASLSGAMLEFFHAHYYHVFAGDSEGDEVSQLLGRPYAAAIAAGSDGTAAAAQLERICRGWRLRSVSPPLVVRNGLTQTAHNILAPKTLGPDCAVVDATSGEPVNDACGTGKVGSARVSGGVHARCTELGGLVAAHLLL